MDNNYELTSKDLVRRGELNKEFNPTRAPGRYNQAITNAWHSFVFGTQTPAYEPTNTTENEEISYLEYQAKLLERENRSTPVNPLEQMLGVAYRPKRGYYDTKAEEMNLRELKPYEDKITSMDEMKDAEIDMLKERHKREIRGLNSLNKLPSNRYENYLDSDYLYKKPYKDLFFIEPKGLPKTKAALKELEEAIFKDINSKI